MEKQLYELRTDYVLAKLYKKDVNRNPIVQFKTYLPVYHHKAVLFPIENISIICILNLCKT